jgi:predicted nucleotidyltransferase
MAKTLSEIVRQIRTEEAELRLRGIVHLAVFGSVARGDERSDSDVDIAVEIESGRSFSLIRMEDTRLFSEDRLGRPIDLGETESFRPQVRAAFEREQVPVFWWRGVLPNRSATSSPPLATAQCLSVRN